MDSVAGKLEFLDSILASEENCRMQFGIRSPYLSFGGVSEAVLGSDLGVEKVAVFPFSFSAPTVRCPGLVTVVVFPRHLTSAVEEYLLERLPSGVRLEVMPPDIIPIDGEIDVLTVASLSDQDALTIAATAQNKVNPPFGTIAWGDLDFSSKLTTAIQDASLSVIAVLNLKLKHADTGVAIEDLDIKPWSLFEIQKSIQFNWLRT